MMSGSSKALKAVMAGLGLCAASGAWAQIVHFPQGRPQLNKTSELPNWSGTWERAGDNVWDNRIPPGQAQLPPYNEEYKKLAATLPDPPRGSPLGAFQTMPALMNHLFPMDLQISPMQVTIMSPNKQARRIYTDGRTATENTLYTTTGYSVGKWVNGELHVETCCVREDTRLPGGGPHSDVMSIKERFYLRDHKTLVLEMTIDDPKAFTRPWTVEKVWYRRPFWEWVENVSDEHLAPIPAPAGN
jgi:hypothetical protein